MATELSESNVTMLRLAVKEGLEEITKLESRLYPRNPEAFHLRTCFYAVKAVLDEPKKEEPQTAYQRLRAKHPAERSMQDYVDAAKERPDYRKEGLKDKIEFPWGVVEPWGVGRFLFMDESPKEDDPELLLTVGQMKELFDNLVFAEFTKEEALYVVAQVARK